MAKPTPLPLGRPNPHIAQSRGAESYIMNFYVTNYSTSFAKPSIEFNKGNKTDIPAYSGGTLFKPRSAPDYTRSGFTSNIRPQIYYNRTLDNYDNPEMGRMLEDNYETVTQKTFKAYRLNDGNEELPVKVVDQNTAFTYKTNHNPREKEVSEMYVNTKLKAPYEISPKHAPILHKISSKNPLTNENFGHGPGYMSTEYSTKFDLSKKNESEKVQIEVGPKEDSGFVTNQEKEEPLTYVAGERWQFNNRPTGNTDYKDHYLPYHYPRSETFLPNIVSDEKTRESTYTKSFKPSDINPKGDSKNLASEYKNNYVGKQSLDPKLSEQLGTGVVGRKELGGQARCERAFVQTLDDPRRFVTNYQMKFYDMNPKGKDREGFVTGGVIGSWNDGFVINNKNNHVPNNINPQYELASIDSYQSRSIRARDQFYDDHYHESKLNSLI